MTIDSEANAPSTKWNCLSCIFLENTFKIDEYENVESPDNLLHISHRSEIANKAVGINNNSNNGIVKCNGNIRNKTSKRSLANLNFPSVIRDKSQSDSVTFNLVPKGLNFGHLNIQGICGKNMCKFSEIEAILTAPENRSLHIFGISETKLKSHKLSSCFNIEGKNLFAKIMMVMAVEVSLYMSETE